MKLLSKLGWWTILVGAGYALSYSQTDPQYEVKRINNQTFIQDKITNSSHYIKRIDNDFYVGDINHQIKGAYLQGAKNLESLLSNYNKK